MEQTEKQLLLSIVNKLESIEGRLDRLENTALKEGQNTLAMLVDVIDEKFGNSPEDCLQSYNGLQEVVEIGKLLKDPEVLGTFRLLLESAPLLSSSLENLKQIPNLISVASDAVDGFFNEASANGLDIEEIRSNLVKLTRKLVVLVEDGSFNKLFDSGIMDHASITFVGAMGRSLSESACEVRPQGPMSIITALFDVNVRKSVGFMNNFARHLGQHISQNKSCNENTNRSK